MFQREGPPPGNYEYSTPPGLHAVSSSFKSKTPRFVTSHTVCQEVKSLIDNIKGPI